MLILSIILLGLFAGWIAHLLVGRGRPDWTQLFIAGLLGSFVGGLIASLVSGDGIDLRPSGIIGSIVGATVLLVIMNAMRRRSGPAHR